MYDEKVAKKITEQGQAIIKESQSVVDGMTTVTKTIQYVEPEMNYADARKFVFEVLLPLLHDRLKEVYPDMYDVCHKTGEEHKQANHSMYSYYGKASNELVQLPQTPKYGKFKKNTNEYSYLKDMYEDLKNAECPVVWMVESIPLGVR